MTTDHGLRITTTDYGLRITDYGLRITDYGLLITDYGLFMKIDHIAIAVRSISDSLGFYHEALGLDHAHQETVDDQGVNVALISVGESRIELLEPISEETPVGRFIARRGEGLHHICYEVDDLNSRLDLLKSRGVRLLEGYPRRGAEGKLVAFLHPANANGVLVELVQKTST